jgi:hypothetical protein
MNHYMDFDHLRHRGALTAGAHKNARAAPQGAVARGARIEWFANRCLRQEGREDAAA